MNIKSSRSHTIFQLLIEEIFPATKSYRVIPCYYLENETESMRFGRIVENQQGLKDGK